MSGETSWSSSWLYCQLTSIEFGRQWLSWTSHLWWREQFHGHDLTHERRGNSYGEVSEQDIGITNIGESDLILEDRDVFYMGGEVCVVLVLGHSFGG